jgi:glycosyltransferase involved in cell wall biosynthesis
MRGQKKTNVTAKQSSKFHIVYSSPSQFIWRMANITIVTQFFPPETNAAANRISSLAEALSKRFQVVVHTLMPGYPSPELYGGVDIKNLDSRFSFQIHRLRHFHPHRPSLLRRGLNELQMSFQLLIKAWWEPTDLIVVSSPSMFLGLVGWLLARLQSAKFLWDIRDITWRYVREKTPKSAVAKWAAGSLELMMNSLLRRADLISCATPGIAQQLTNGIVPSERVFVVQNGVTQEFLDTFDNIEFDDFHGQPVVTYVGLVGYNQGLSVLVEVAQLLSDVRFYVVGDGPELEGIRGMSQAKQVGNIEFTGYLRREAITAIYKKSTILFAQLKDTPTLNSTGNPSKLLEYMAVEKPIVYAGRGFAEEFLRGIGCSIVVPPGDAASIASAISILLKDIPLRRSMGTKGRAFVRENYLREAEADRFTDEIAKRFVFSPRDSWKSGRLSNEINHAGSYHGTKSHSGN